MLTIRITASNYWGLTMEHSDIKLSSIYLNASQSPYYPCKAGIIFSTLHMRKLKLSDPTEFIRGNTASSRTRNWGPSISKHKVCSPLCQTIGISFLLLHNQLAQTGQLKTTHMYYLPVSVG